MKRMTLIAIALCLVMIATIGAGAVAAKQTEPPRQAGTSHIYFYDVQPTDPHGKGKLQINVDQHTFEFNGKGFPPSQQIELKARAVRDTPYVAFATGKTTPSGNLHIAGTWEAGAAPADVLGSPYYAPISGFMLGNSGGFVAKLACYYSTNGGATWTESSPTDGITMGNSVGATPGDLHVPVDALVKIHAIVVAGNDRTGSEVFQYYPLTNDGSQARADYDISGTTLTSKLTYLGRVVGCPSPSVLCWCLGGCM